MQKYKTVIIGCGSIGALKPDRYDFPGGENILTHAHACHNHSRIELYGLMDINLKKAVSASEKWMGTAYHAFNCPCKLMSETEPDIVIIASLTNTHLVTVRKIMSYKPKIIILEKPAGQNLSECQEIQKLSYDYDVPIMVNYIRRFDPHMQTIQKELRHSDIYNCIFLCSNNLLYYGSHAIDLAGFFFGKFERVKSTNPIISLEYERCPQVIFIPINNGEYRLFEVDILTKEGRITLLNQGLKLVTYPVGQSIYGDFNTLSCRGEETKIKLNRTLLRLLSNVVDYIEDRSSLICTIDDAVAVHSVLEHLRVRKNPVIVKCRWEN